MKLDDEQRGALGVTVATKALDLLAAETARAQGDEDDMLSVGVGALIGAALSLAAAKLQDRAAAVALLTCVADSIAADMFGTAP